MSDILERDQVISHCESLIEQIEDIVSAKIETDDEGKISEIHVVSKSDRNPKQIIRYIESTLIAFLGTELERKKISVAQANDKKMHSMEGRLRIQGISTHQTLNYLEVKVMIADSDGGTFEGRAKGTASLHSRMSTAARAAIDAVQLFAGDGFLISLEDVCAFNIGDHQAISVLVSIIKGERDEQLLGSALVAHDLYEAVAQAVLNAVNINF